MCVLCMRGVLVPAVCLFTLLFSSILKGNDGRVLSGRALSCLSYHSGNPTATALQ